MADLPHLIEQLKNVGPVLPGTLEKFYHACGKPGCRCKDKSNPQLHGPYYRLSYSLAGKNSCLFVKEEHVRAVEKMVQEYKKLRQLTMEFALAILDLVRQEGVEATLQQFQTMLDERKDKLHHKREALKAAQGKIRDLTQSRDKWKQECMELRTENEKMQQKLERSEQKIRSMEEAAEKGKKRGNSARPADHCLPHASD